MNIVRPCVHIYGNPYGEAFIKEVLAGLEEEGVLYEVYMVSEKNADKMANEAANSSLLGVGLGIDKEYVCVTLAKLSFLEPLLKYKTCEKQNLRLSGSNAARLVKGSKLRL